MPEAITSDEFNAANALMTADESTLWSDAFGADAADSGGIYYRRELSEDELDALDEALLKPLVTRYAEKNGETLADAEAMAGSDTGNIKESSGKSREINSNMLAMGIAYAGDCDRED